MVRKSPTRYACGTGITYDDIKWLSDIALGANLQDRQRELRIRNGLYRCGGCLSAYERRVNDILDQVRQQTKKDKKEYAAIGKLEMELTLIKQTKNGDEIAQRGYVPGQHIGTLQKPA